MDKVPVIEAGLTKAKDALKLLENDLPQFHALLTENEKDAQRLKSECASLDTQAQAKGRVNVARELLEQHQADIQAARAKLVRLEAQERREQTLVKMAAHAKNATRHRRELEKAVHEGSEVLGRALETMAQAFAGIRQERAAFAQTGMELGPTFNGQGYYGGMEGDEKRRLCEVIVNELEARGVTLTDALYSQRSISKAG